MKENFLCSKKSYSCSSKNRPAFSLVEMLMALLVASLLLAALAPVMTRKMDEGMSVSVEGGVPGKKTKTHTIEYGSAECSNVKKDADGSEYCEGEFIVPVGYNGDMKITVVGAGGGGGVAPSAGYKEYTTPGSTSAFTVPAIVNEIEATLVSGGAGGGAGGQVLINKDFAAKIGGGQKWDIPEVARGKTVLVSGCGAGGGGGGGGWKVGGKGGNGGIAYNIPFTTLADETTYPVVVGFRGGVGASCGKNASQTGSAVNDKYNVGGGGGGCGGYNRYVRANAGSGGAVTLTSCTILNPVQDTNLTGQGGTGATILAGKVGCTSPGMGGNWHYNIGGGGGGGLSSDKYYQPNSIEGIASHGGGGGGAGTQLGNWYSRKKISFGGGGGGGGAAGGGGGGGGGGLNSGGGGGGGKEVSSPYSFNTAPGQGGAGGNGAENGKPGSDSTGGAGGNGGWATGESETVGPVQPNHAYKSDIFPGKCLGGASDKEGQDGALRISYLSYGPGGGGGGGSIAVPIQKESVIAGEILNVKVGRGSKGGTAGYIDTAGKIISNTSGEDSTYNTTEPGHAVTKIIRTSNNTMLFSTCFKDAHVCGPIAGSPDGGLYFDSPHYGKGAATTTNSITTYGTGLTITGFYGSHGKTANNGTDRLYGTDKANFPNGSTGGDGGGRTIFGNITCTPGKGGTLSNPKGGNATGYGCGGGGGYGLADGGNGSGGYVRISWNKYWDAAKSIYKYAETGTAGGGASGNVMTYTIQGAKSGDKIKIRIGKGGTGAYINNNQLVPAQKGGDTVFGYGTTNKLVSAGGGTAGGSASINSGTNNLTSGKGGSTSNICKGTNNKDYLNIQCTASLTTNCCIPGTKGEDGINGNSANNKLSSGGKGGTLNKYGAGGNGGITGDNANGKNADSTGNGGGGGGAGILEVGTPSVSTYNPNTGGNGSNGKILIEWWE